MAQKKSSSAKRKAPAKKSNVQKIKKQEKRTPIREYAACVCIILGFFGILRYFPFTDGWLIKILSDFDVRMIGWSANLVPLMFIACAVILFSQHEKPVKLRIFSVVMIPLVAGALYHLIFCDKNYEFGFGMIRELWKDAPEVSSGGVLAGSLAILFIYILSKIGAAVVLFALLIVFSMLALNLSAKELIEKYRSRERKLAAELKQEQEQENEIEYPKTMKENDRHKKSAKETEDRAARSEQIKERPAQKNRLSEYDLPVDDPILPVKEPQKIVIEPFFEKKPAFFNRNPGVKTPDQVVSGKVKREPMIGFEDMPEHTEQLTAQKQEVINTDIKEEAVFPEISSEVIEKQLEPVTEPEVLEPEPEFKTIEKKSIQKTVKTSEAENIETGEQTQYHFPPVTLLEANPAAYRGEAIPEEDPYKDRLEMSLKSFGINSGITNIVHGPSVTRYEMELEVGVKLNKLTSLSDDIALSLGASGVRIAAIPNKMSTVGIEVPNKRVTKVYLREIIESQKFIKAPSKLTFAIGKDISGEPIIGDIAKLPHMLVAGTTGSGKSVCLNSLILSILYKAKPDEVKFIMVDPKMVEFKIYNGIPHLHTPVVTEAKKASGALQWAVVEMMKRYRLFSEAGARELTSYNKIAEGNDEFEKKPQIVVVIDELADLMMVAAKEVEDSIVRIAQMGRAAGIHLVIATQSPRAEIITGLMKANIPSRIALKVSSALESRIILDAGGNADKLVGNGDMLYVPVGTSKPVRVQGTWVSDEEREQIIDFIKTSSDVETVYSEEAIQYMDKAAEEKQTNGKQENEANKDEQYDELLTKAVDVILDSGQASVSMLQRRLKLGYARAARLVDQMEERGIVGPFEGSKPRQILITKQQWQEMQFIQGTAPVSDLNQTLFAADDLLGKTDGDTGSE